MKKPVTLEEIVSLCKRRGFVFPGSEIYGGFAGTFDYGPLGVVLKENIKKLWWKMFVEDRDDMYGIEATILMNPKAWESSGHVSGFNDPLVECKKCQRRFRADHVEIFVKDKAAYWKCENCGEENKAQRRQFNMMFKTHAGVVEDDSTLVYLRPETAAGIFVNFKNVIDAFHPKLPFGLAQIGKVFRNEIAPRDFIFRLRELEQMEVEYFVKPDAWKEAFEEWKEKMQAFANACGIRDVHELEIEKEDRAHYSERTVDFEFDYPFGRKELWGLAYRANFDLEAHSKGSSTQLEYVDEATGDKITPHVIEPSLGVDRTILAVLLSSYHEDELGGEKRVVLRLEPKIAPIKGMVSPLLKNKPELVDKAREVRSALRKIHPAIAWDDNGNIGKRYRRQDEIGTPWCITVDFDTLGETPELKDTVTLRERDTGDQTRMTVDEVSEHIKNKLA